MLNFSEWFYFNEAKKPSEIALNLVGGDTNFLIKLGEILPDGIKPEEKNKYLLVAAYFSKSQPDLRTLGNDIDVYNRLVGRNKMKLFTFDDNGNLNPQFRQYSNYLEWTSAMHGMEAEEKKKVASRYKPSEGDFSRLSPIFVNHDGSIKVFKAKNVADAIILGRGTNFCISQPGNTMYKSYRDSHAATFYFVFDSNRDDNLNIVVVDVGDGGRILLTDKINRTGSCQNPDNSKTRNTDHKSYFAYLKSLGVNLSIFKNEPHNEEEKIENELLGNENSNYNWFVSLPTEKKSAYIGRGHRLSDEQFDFLFKHKLRDLLEQYVSTGLNLIGNQLNLILSDKDLGKKYMHFRIIGIENNSYAPPINEEEFEFAKKNMKDEEKNLINSFADFIDNMGVYGRVEDGLIRKLLDDGDEELISELMKRIKIKVDKTLNKDRTYVVPISFDERNLLKDRDMGLLKSILIHNSHAGIELSKDDWNLLNDDDLKGLHPYAKMIKSFDDNDEEVFKHHFDSLEYHSKPLGMNHPDYNKFGNFDDDDYGQRPDHNTDLITGALAKNQRGIADHVLKKKISEIKNVSQFASDPVVKEFGLSLVGNKLSDLAKQIIDDKQIDMGTRLKYVEKLLNSGASNLKLIINDFLSEYIDYARSNIADFEPIEKLVKKLREFYRNSEDDSIKNSTTQFGYLKSILSSIGEKYKLISNYVNPSEAVLFKNKINELSNMVKLIDSDIDYLNNKFSRGSDLDYFGKKLDIGSGRAGKIGSISGKYDKWSRI